MRMLSHAAIAKLKAILVIDIIIIAAVAGTYLYLQSQGLISAAKPAKFTLKYLAINPSNTTLGDAVQISVNVTNVGNLEGNQTFNFEINNAVVYTGNVTLAGGASQIIKFNEVETTYGNYSVEVGDLSGMFTINPAPPSFSKIILTNIYTTPDEVWPNQPLNVITTAENPSNEADNLTVRVMVDNALVETEIIQLNAGATENEQFTVNSTTVGQHTVSLNTLSSSFSVVPTGYHTLIVSDNGAAYTNLTFTLNGVSYTA